MLSFLMTDLKEIHTSFLVPVMYCKINGYSPMNRAFRMFLMILRYDNTFGFIGGKINKNETPLQAMIRESKEEANLDIDESKIKHFGEFIEITSNHKIISNLYSINLGIFELENAKKLLSNSNVAESSIVEGSAVLIHAYGKNYKKFRTKSNFAIGVGKELDIVSKEYLEFICIQ